MIEILPDSKKKTLAFAISGELTSEDYEQLRPEMDLRADQYESFDLLVEIRDVGDVEPSVIMDELEFTKEYAKSINHMAVVTDESIWTGLADFVGSPLGKALGVELERFDERSVALAWLESHDEN